MTLPEQMAAPGLPELLRDATLAGEWMLDPSRSIVALKNRSVRGLVPVNGVFRQVTGTGTVSPSGQVRGTFTVAATSVDTKNTRRDNHLRSADFFDARDYPNITFVLSEIRPSALGVTVTGMLTVLDRSRPLMFDAAAVMHGTSEVWLDTVVTINQADFGLTWNFLGMVARSTTITIHAVFTKR